MSQDRKMLTLEDSLSVAFMVFSDLLKSHSTPHLWFLQFLSLFHKWPQVGPLWRCNWENWKNPCPWAHVRIINNCWTLPEDDSMRVIKKPPHVDELEEHMSDTLRPRRLILSLGWGGNERNSWTKLLYLFIYSYFCDQIRLLLRHRAVVPGHRVLSRREEKGNLVQFRSSCPTCTFVSVLVQS